MGKSYKERKIVSRIVKQSSKTKNPDIMVQEMAKVSYRKKNVICNPAMAAEYFDIIRGKKQEHFAVATFDGARQLINCHIVTIGTLTSSLVHPREVFAHAIEDRAASIIVAHNHPSGNLDISTQDRKVADIIKKLARL